MNNLRISFAMGVVIVILLSTLGCGSDEISGTAISGSGNLVTQEIGYRDFTKIEVDHAFQAEISRADIYYVNIIMDDNLFDYLIADVTGDTLYIGLEPDTSYQNTTGKVNITLPDLRHLKLRGASTAEVSGFVSDSSFQIEISGASRLFFQDVEAGDTQFNISGASQVSGSIETAECGLLISGASVIELHGSASDALINISGVSTLLLGDFVIDNASILLSGTSSATINVTGRLDANLGGVSNLDYLGNPTLGTAIMSDSSAMNQGG